MFSKISIILVFIASAKAYPAEDPIRIDLPVYDQSDSESKYNLAKPLEPESHPAESLPDKSYSNNVIGINFEGIGNKLAGPFTTRKTKPEHAAEETEGYGSKILSVQENLGKAAAGIFQPKPIVDTITEDEKYGNTGDKFYKAGNAVVTTSSRLSTFVNTLLEIPGTLIRQLTRAASEKLNNIGGKIVGL